jgi:ADP-ribosylglycohydrolase
MLGAIAGDMIGSICEAGRSSPRELPLLTAGATFTDDTVCTMAIADALLTGGDFAQCLRAYVHCYPDPGYGGMFARLADAPGMPAWQ